jgi:hypothetical protein
VFRIDRYTSGFATAGCGPWRAGPAVAPFDGKRVTLARSGNRLIASGSGSGTRVEFDRITVIDQVVDAERLLGTWRLAAERGHPLTGRDRATLVIGPAFDLRGNCAFYSTDGVAALPGLIINPGGSQVQQNAGPCADPGTGDRLVAGIVGTIWRYDPGQDRILAERSGARRRVFVRSAAR